jgi:hypothetical protein
MNAWLLEAIQKYTQVPSVVLVSALRDLPLVTHSSD